MEIEKAAEGARRGTYVRRSPELKAAIAMAGETPAADKAAKALVAAIEKYVPEWRALQSYNTARKYEDDNGAEGKRLLVVYHEGQDALRTSLMAFSKEVDALSDTLHEKNLAEYRAEGKLLEMHTLVAMGSAEKILGTFGAAEDFADSAKVESANRELAAMEEAIKGMREEHAKRKAEDAAGKQRSLPRLDQYDSVANHLETLGGAYRQARKDASSFNNAVRAYNNAVDSFNMMSR